jgi:hypothetical protein
MIATPCYGGQLTMAYVQSVTALQAACFARGLKVILNLRGGEALITRARADLAGEFLASSATHLLFIDADIGFKPEQVFRLLAFGAEIAGAAYPLKGIDWDKVGRAARSNRPNLEAAALNYVVYWDGEGQTVTARNDFARVRYAGTGFLLVARSALERLCEAHPELRYKVATTQADLAKDGPHRFALFECMIDPVTSLYLSEDYAFCRRWTDLGGEIWLDLKSELTHYGNIAFRGNLAQQFEPKQADDQEAGRR